MNRTKVPFFYITMVAALFCAIFAACGSSPAPSSSADELDAAIREASTYLNGKVPKGSKAAFLNIKSDYPDLSEYILSVLSENAVNDGVFSVVDRQQLDLIRTEQNFQMSGEVSDASAQSIGQMLGAQSIVSGAVSKIGSLYRVQVKAIEVQTAGVHGQWSRNVPNGATIAALTEKYAPAPTGTAAASVASGAGSRTPVSAPVATPVQAVPAQAPAPASVPAAPAVTYKVGDKGPAGGFVFFDMGFYMDGWRYLEAAPQDFPTKVQWGDLGVLTDIRETGVGTGKENTMSMISILRNNGQTMRAAQVVTVAQYGGYDDWFLPSKDELELMYVNLKKQRIGGFSNEVYWSSSSNTSRYIDVGHTGVWQINFFDGKQINAHYYNEGFVRAIRAF